MLGNVIRKETGLLITDTFDSSSLHPMWEMVPNTPARWSLTSGVLRLMHGDSPVFAFITDLTEQKQFVLDVRNTYNPLTAGDEGGIVVYGNDNNLISLDEYYDETKGTTESHPWLRLVRDYNTYTAYWSEDGVTWQIVGTEPFNNIAPKIGLFLSGAAGENLDVEEVRVMSSPYVYVSNLTEGATVELLDATGAVVAAKVCREGDTQVRFDVSGLALPFTGSFRITLSDGTTVIDSPLGSLSIWAGDEYLFGAMADLFFENESGAWEPVHENYETFLGYMNTGTENYREVKMKAVNLLAGGTFTSVSLELAGPDGTGAPPDSVKIAADMGGAPGSCGTSLTISNLGAGAEQTFWIKLERELDPDKSTSQITFAINAIAVYI